MPKSRNRKAHKEKSKKRSNQILARRKHAMELVSQLEEQLKIVRDNPQTGVDIQPTEMLTITGSLPSYEIKI
jgi:hypothetical protein